MTSTIFDAISCLADFLVSILSSNIVMPFVGLMIVSILFTYLINLFRR